MPLHICCGALVSLDLLAICALSPLLSSSQLSPSYPEWQSVTAFERSIAGFQQGPDLRIQPGFLVCIFSHCSSAGDFLHTFVDVAEDSRCIVAQIHFFFTDSLLPEDLPVCALEAVLQYLNIISGQSGDGPLCCRATLEQITMDRKQHDGDLVRGAEVGLRGRLCKRTCLFV